MENEKQALQINSGSIHNLLQIPTEWWLHFALIFCMASSALSYTGGIAAMIVLRFVFWRIEKEQQLSEAKARAAAWANIAGPVVICSMHPGETVDELHDRAEAFRQALVLSGNPYAEKIPIIEYPYRPLLVDYGQLPVAWSKYMREAGELQHAENMRWYERSCPNELKQLFASAVLPAPKQPEL